MIDAYFNRITDLFLFNETNEKQYNKDICQCVDEAAQMEMCRTTTNYASR